MSRIKNILGFALAALFSLSVHAQAGVAEGFTKLPGNAKVVLMPMDVELFSMSAGGVLEPQAEWTNKALGHLKTAFDQRAEALQLKFLHLPDNHDEAVDELNRLHGAVGAAIVMHHLGVFKLPTKEGKFDWTLGEGVESVGQKTGADYALFTFIRDSYASSERVAAMVVGAILGIGLTGGIQYGYSSLVDLRTGQVVWFNRIVRANGDLREVDKAAESLGALLEKFPS